MNLTKILEVVFSYMNASWKKAKDKNKDESSENFWGQMLTSISESLGILDKDLYHVGISPSVILSSNTNFITEATYKKVILKDGNGKITEVEINDALKKITPYTKNFKTPMEAVKAGNYDDILKAFQLAYGDGITTWGIPVEEGYSPISKLLAYVLYEGIYKAPDRDRMRFIQRLSKVLEDYDSQMKTNARALFKDMPEVFVDALIMEAKKAFDTVKTDKGIKKLFPQTEAIRPRVGMRVREISHPERLGTVYANVPEGDKFYRIFGGDTIIRWDDTNKSTREAWLVDVEPIKESKTEDMPELDVEDEVNTELDFDLDKELNREEVPSGEGFDFDLAVHVPLKKDMFKDITAWSTLMDVLDIDMPDVDKVTLTVSDVSTSDASMKDLDSLDDLEFDNDDIGDDDIDDETIDALLQDLELNMGETENT